MQIKVSIVNGVWKAQDPVTGAWMDWVEEVSLVKDAAGRPFLFLGTSKFTMDTTVGSVPSPRPTTPGA